MRISMDTYMEIHSSSNHALRARGTMADIYVCTHIHSYIHMYMYIYNTCSISGDDEAPKIITVMHTESEPNMEVGIVEFKSEESVADKEQMLPPAFVKAGKGRLRLWMGVVAGVQGGNPHHFPPWNLICLCGLSFPTTEFKIPPWNIIFHHGMTT